MAKEKFDFIQPIKDIPKTLKGFPKNIVSIWKDPVKNSDQVKQRKKEIFPYLYLFSALLLVTLILYVAIPAIQDVMMIVAMIPGFCVIGCVFLLQVLKKAQEKFTDLECPNCKARIKYTSDVQITVTNKSFTVTKKKDYMSEVNRQHVNRLSPMYCEVNGKETTTAQITCKCQECGTEKTFTHSFVTAECTGFQNKIAAENIDIVLMELEKAVREEGAEGFEEKKTGTTPRGVEIKYNRQILSQVIDYFGDIIQMR